MNHIGPIFHNNYPHVAFLSQIAKINKRFFYTYHQKKGPPMKNMQLFFCLLFTTITSHGMHKSLSEIEEHIFLREVNRIGTSTALQHIKEPIEPQYITWDIYPQSKDPLAQLIITTINELETQRTSHKIAKRGYIGNYTQYWHKIGHNGAYIKLEANFYDKNSLLDVLNNQ